MYACSALFTLVFELDLEVYAVCTGILQVTESDNLFVQCCCIGCYSNNNVCISKMPQGSLSTSESVKPLLDAFSIRFVNIGFHVVCSEYKKENPFESYMPIFFFLSIENCIHTLLTEAVLIRDTQALSTLVWNGWWLNHLIWSSAPFTQITWVCVCHLHVKHWYKCTH